MSVNRLLTEPEYLETDHDIREAFDKVPPPFIQRNVLPELTQMFKASKENDWKSPVSPSWSRSNTILPIS